MATRASLRLLACILASREMGSDPKEPIPHDPAGDARLHAHLHRFFDGHQHRAVTWTAGPALTELPGFHVLEFAPGKRTSLWTYVSVGASRIRHEGQPRLEFILMTAQPTDRAVELLAMTVHYHRHQVLGWSHTFPIGQPWLEGSRCDHILVSKPYPFGPDLEILDLDGEHAHLLWLLPITESERRFKMVNDMEALEQAFDAAALQYWDVGRKSVI
ncbi:MAG: suppressor of fused domain protein [Acidobacteriota bacterium]